MNLKPCHTAISENFLELLLSIFSEYFLWQFWSIFISDWLIFGQNVKGMWECWFCSHAYINCKIHPSVNGVGSRHWCQMVCDTDTIRYSSMWSEPFDMKLSKKKMSFRFHFLKPHWKSESSLQMGRFGIDHGLHFDGNFKSYTTTFSASHIIFEVCCKILRSTLFGFIGICM